jgi:hypothetical protein
MLAFGSVAGISIIAKAVRRPAEGGGFSVLQIPGAKAGYFQLWRRACEKKGLAGRTGWTLKRQIAEMEEPPAFAEDLRGYHYALRYEGRPPDADLERRLVSEIKGWDQAGISKPLR